MSSDVNQILDEIISVENLSSNIDNDIIILSDDSPSSKRKSPHEPNSLPSKQKKNNPNNDIIELDSNGLEIKPNSPARPASSSILQNNQNSVNQLPNTFSSSNNSKTLSTQLSSPLNGLNISNPDQAQVEKKEVKSLANSLSNICSQFKESLIFYYEHTRLRVTVEKGSVFECNVDVVVNSINTSLDPNYSLTATLAKLIGDEFKNQLKNYSSLQYIHNLAIYQFAITTNHFNQSKNVTFGNVFNCCINDFDYTSDMSEIHYKNTILELLKLAEHFKLTSIAIPVIGCGQKKYPPHLVVKWIDEAIKKYMLSYNCMSSLETIRIVLDKSNPSVIEPFQRYYNEKLSFPVINALKHRTLIDEYELVLENSNSDEYKLISSHFALTMGTATIDKVNKLVLFYPFMKLLLL